MYPELFRIGPLTIHSFGATLAISFLLIAWLGGREYVRRGFTADDAWSVTLAAMIGGMLGAKLYFVLDHFGEALESPRSIIFSGSGLTYYGGMFAGAAAVLWQGARRHIPRPTLADMGAPLIALGYGLGRIGCLLNGDDYGRATTLPWGMTFPNGSPPTLERVHPTQLYEAGASLAFFFALWATRRSLQVRPGLTFAIYLVLAGAERFLVEFVRVNPPVVLGLTMAQILSVGVFGLGLVLLGRTLRR